MSDSTEQNDPAPPLPPPPPPSGTGAAAPQIPQQVIIKQGPGCWKIGGIVVAVLAVLGLIGGGCTVLLGVATVQSIDQAVLESVGLADTTDFTLEVTGCDADPFFSASATGTITNTSDTERAFQIKVKFTNPDGSLISTDSDFTDKLNPGQSTGWRVVSFSGNDATPGFLCDVTEVSNSIFGS
jgi:hypothetical protein